MVSEHLTLTGFDARVYLGAARAQAAAMRGVMGMHNQARHTVLGGVTIDVRIQDSHTYIKIDTGGVAVWYFITRVKDLVLYVYGTTDPLKPPKLLTQVPVTYLYPNGVGNSSWYSTAVAPNALGYAGGHVNLALVPETDKAYKLFLDTRGWAVVQSAAAALASIELLLFPDGATAKARALYQSSAAVASVSANIFAAPPATVDWVSGFNFPASNDAARVAAGWSRGYTPVAYLPAADSTPIYLGSGRLLFWYTVTYGKQGASYTTISGGTGHYNYSAKDYYRAYSVDYGTTWTVTHGSVAGLSASVEQLLGGTNGGVGSEQPGRYPGNVLYYVTVYTADATSGEIHESVDYGLTYRRIATTQPYVYGGPPYPGTLASTNMLRVASESWVWGGSSGGNIFTSTDNGVTWQNRSNLTLTNRSRIFVLYPSRSPFAPDNTPAPIGYIARTTAGATLWVSRDAGATWGVAWLLSARAEPVVDAFGGNSDAAFSDLCMIPLENKK